MFDIGFWEFSLIAIVALVVVGPEKLPELTRTAGKLIGRARRTMRELKYELERDAEFEEVNRLRNEFSKKQLDDIAKTLDEPIDIDEEKINRVLQTLLEDERVVDAEISLALVDNPTLRELNVQYLGHDYDTDVLSFLLEEEQFDETDPTKRGAGKKIDGELIISTDMACHMALEYSWSAENEMLLYIVHGTLHLLGYDDLTDQERPIMRQREKEVLALCQIELPSSKPSSNS